MSFTGSDADERVTFADVQVTHVGMGGGDDTMTVSALNHSIVPLSADGGLGRDSAYLSAVCSRAFSVKLDRIAVCDSTSGPFTGFRDVVIDGGRTTTLIGTDRSLWVNGDDVVVRGQAGRDRIKLLGTAGVDPAGRSADRLVGGRGRTAPTVARDAATTAPPR